MPEHNHAEKRCQDLLQDLSLYIDHEASAAMCEEIERHLADCADCEVVFDTLQLTISLYHALPQAEMPEHLRQRLYRTFHLEQFLSEAKSVSGDEDQARPL